jgi:hypothetical protein
MMVKSLPIPWPFRVPSPYSFVIFRLFFYSTSIFFTHIVTFFPFANHPCLMLFLIMGFLASFPSSPRNFIVDLASILFILVFFSPPYFPPFLLFSRHSFFYNPCRLSSLFLSSFTLSSFKMSKDLNAHAQ